MSEITPHSAPLTGEDPPLGPEDYAITCKCGNQEFMLLASGEVICMDCEKQMAAIRVTLKPGVYLEGFAGGCNS